MSTIVRHHPQTVFEEFQLLGRVPGSDAWASKYVRASHFHFQGPWCYGVKG